MNIESPEFPHRKVVHDSQQVGGFGFERAQLASYVADQLNNNHRNDAAILQKFRKQAQQYKRNLLHRKHNRPIEMSSQPNFLPPPVYPNNVVLSTKTANQELRVSTSHIQEHRKKEQFKQPTYHKSPIIIRQVQRDPNEGNRQLIKMLQRKDKMIEKQTKIISKNERKMSELKRRIDILEQQNRIKENNRLASLQTDSYSKIRDFISSMSNKLLENKSLIQENLMSGRNTNNDELFISKNKSALVEKAPKHPGGKISKKYNPEILQRQPQPRIEYKYKIGTEKEMHEQKYGLKSAIYNLGSSRNRLDALGGYTDEGAY